ncbi:hypothetical protein Cob_v012043 [Colletotrichum orbiculare MAFF 240422]|uniref:Uncharacterized protein n=1 Tax=Colletotrichum orbiculare (strain 104-T / ATCC 96160 / CBS 514.97 / LARS 414 / MAFF 240422) TaxID=1213857 RepID=A0A484F9I0_COLOR|nr:hypothetical protein Cob_v012043 [Colletotrichum orbiculare MAFF 240422]
MLRVTLGQARQTHKTTMCIESEASIVCNIVTNPNPLDHRVRGIRRISLRPIPYQVHGLAHLTVLGN